MNKRKLYNIIKYILVIMAFFAATFLLFTTQWILSTWKSLTIDEIIFHIKMPITGTSKDTIIGYCIPYGLFIILLSVFFILALLLTKSKKNHKLIIRISIVYCVLAFIVVFVRLNNRLNMIGYYNSRLEDSDFIDNNYVMPQYENISFPNNKRNLIYIYLESVETTFADKANGGAFDTNVIPELTQLSQENIDFSGEDKKINGGYVLPGTTWTMGAIFGQSSGLPLNSEVDANNLDTQENFYPTVISLGDILKANGYNNFFMLGSDARFGGREIYFKQHGDYFISDYNYAIDNMKIPSDYYEFWGYEDEKLFQYAKDELLELSSDDQPFNLTLLTVDTHFEDGYICRLCKDEFEDNQYANVMACSSRQVYDFIEWIKKQEFYDNTTVVISGDHLTMDSDFCNEIEGNYDRKVYTCYINSACKEGNEKKRLYSTFDNFPTTLSSLGVKIKGDKLGLGTNLFSKEETILEKYGTDYCREQLSKKSSYLLSMNEVLITDLFVERMRQEGKIRLDFDGDTTTISYDLNELGTNMVGLDDFSYITSLVWTEDSEEIKEFVLSSYDENKKTFCTNINSKNIGKPINVNIYLVDKYNNYYFLGKEYSVATSTDFVDFLKNINNPDYTIFITAKDDASNALTDEYMELLRNLGIKEKLNEGSRKSYYAIISQGEISERMSSNQLRYSGEFQDMGIKYIVKSAGFEVGDYSSIIINNKEYSLNQRGLNFVIYDNQKNKVIMSCNFDTFESLACVVMDLNSDKEKEKLMENYYKIIEE